MRAIRRPGRFAGKFGRRDGDVRKLLRRLRRPHSLEREPLAILLRQALNAPSARDALVAIIELSFDRSSDARFLHEIIQRCDVEGEKARTAAASMHLSLRQFFRYRAEAIAAIGATIARYLDELPSGDHDLSFASMLSAIDPGAALQILQGGIHDSTLQSRADVNEIARWSILSGKQLNSIPGRYTQLFSPMVAVEQAALAFLAGRNEEANALFQRARSVLADSRQFLRLEPAFRLTAYSLVRSRMRGDARLSDTLCAELQAIADGNSKLHALALAEQAYEACLRGDDDRAATFLSDAERLSIGVHDAIISARVALVKASALFVRGSYQPALALATGALLMLAGSEPIYGFLADALAGRVALALGAAWEPNVSLRLRFPHTYLLADVEFVRARHLLKHDVEAAQETAASAMQLVDRCESRVSFVFGRATLALIAQIRGRASEAQDLGARAAREAKELGNRLLLNDLFATPLSVERLAGPATA